MLHRSRRQITHIYSIHILQNTFRLQHFKFVSQVASAEPTPIKHVDPSSNRRHVRTVKSPRKFKPSPAQLAIVEACKTHNVMVSARPGSGKTATAEAIVRANPSTRIAVITYSKRLQLDTQKRLEGYRNADVFTFHGMAGELFNSIVPDDATLNQLRAKRTAPSWRPNYGIVILDEMQDLRSNLFWLIRIFITVLKQVTRQSPRLIVLGDSRQTIFQYQGADARYLELADDVLADITPYSWKSMTLDKSFRLSHETAAFINGFIGEKYVEGSHCGPKPFYLHANVWDHESLVKFLLPRIRKYGPENSVILAPSVRRIETIANLTNSLSKFQIPIAQPASDELPLDDKVLNGKVAVSTYHQFKGCERKLTVVYGVDEPYFTIFGSNLPDDRCPNAMFVALTRACEQLVVIHDSNKSAMPFMSWKKMKRTAEYVNLANKTPRPQRRPGRPIQSRLRLPTKVVVTELCRQFDEEKLRSLVNKYVRIETVNRELPDKKRIKAPSKVLTDKAKKHYEFVSDLNGLAVTAAFEWKRAGTCTTFGYTGKRRSSRRLEKRSGAPAIPESPKARARWFAKEAMKYDTRQGIYKSRYFQMKNHSFDWLDKHLDKTTQCMSQQFRDVSRLKFEAPLSHEFHVQEPNDPLKPLRETKIRGRADIIDWNDSLDKSPTIWEIKFVSSLRLEHVAQVAIYGYLWFMEQTTRKRPAKFPGLVLFNVRNGEKWKIDTTPNDMKGFIEEMLRIKYTSNSEKDKSVFLEECRRTSEEVDLAMEMWKKQMPMAKRLKRKSHTSASAKPGSSRKSTRRQSNINRNVDRD